jgi:hypothetical protein
MLTPSVNNKKEKRNTTTTDQQLRPHQEKKFQNGQVPMTRLDFFKNFFFFSFSLGQMKINKRKRIWFFLLRRRRSKKKKEKDE